MLDLDSRGIPGTMVATTAFTQAAKSQSEKLGFEPSIVWVSHPVQNRTDEELRAMADESFERIVGELTS